MHLWVNLFLFALSLSCTQFLLSGSCCRLQQILLYLLCFFNLFIIKKLVYSFKFANNQQMSLKLTRLNIRASKSITQRIEGKIDRWTMEFERAQNFIFLEGRTTNTCNKGQDAILIKHILKWKYQKIIILIEELIFMMQQVRFL